MRGQAVSPHEKGDSEKEKHKALKQYQETVKRSEVEADSDYGFYSFLDNLAKRFSNKLSGEDIYRADAQRMNELKDKKEKGELTPTEQYELELKERGDLYYSKQYEEVNLPNLGGFMSNGAAGKGTGRLYVETYRELEKIRGVLDGEEIYLEKMHRDKGWGTDPDYAFHEKLPAEDAFDGRIGYAELKPEEAEELFAKFFPFAMKRTEEISKMRLAKKAEKSNPGIRELDEIRNAEKQPAAI